MAGFHLRTAEGRFIGEDGCIALGVTFVAVGLFEFLIAQLMGPGNSDELVSGGPAVIPWFALPAVAMFAGAIAIGRRRTLRIAYGALGVAAASLVAWGALAYFVSD
jgi:hypothetical protein